MAIPIAEKNRMPYIQDMQCRDEPLERAIEIMGSTRALARAIGVSHQTITRWTRCPPIRVLAVEQATGIRREVLRPDVYPDK
jgi:DNA-binding transcriptional regulator YdaS (Cro superfamily)